MVDMAAQTARFIPVRIGIVEGGTGRDPGAEGYFRARGRPRALPARDRGPGHLAGRGGRRRRGEAGPEAGRRREMNISGFSVHRPVFTIMVVLHRDRGPGFAQPPADRPDARHHLPDPQRHAPPTRTPAPRRSRSSSPGPIEEAMSAVPGVEEVTSVSVRGQQQRARDVRLGHRPGRGGQRHPRPPGPRDRRACPRRPTGPRCASSTWPAFPILILGASSNLDPVQMRRIIDDQVKYRLERVPGVAAVDIWGGLEREIHVNLDPDKIKALGIPLDQIIASIREANVNLPAGTIERGNYEITIRTPGEFTGPATSCATPSSPCATACPSGCGRSPRSRTPGRRSRAIVRVNGEPGIRLAVNKQSGTNTVEVADGVLEEIERINRGHPADPDHPDHRHLRLHPALDQQRRQLRRLRRPAGHPRPAALPAQHPQHR